MNKINGHATMPNSQGRQDVATMPNHVNIFRFRYAMLLVLFIAQDKLKH